MYSLKLKLKRNDWLLAEPIIALYFEFENALEFYNLGARPQGNKADLTVDINMGTCHNNNSINTAMEDRVFRPIYKL